MTDNSNYNKALTLAESRIIENNIHKYGEAYIVPEIS